MITRFAAIVAIGLLTACATASASGGAGRPACAAADAKSANMLAMVKEIVMATDPDRVVERDTLGFIAAAPGAVQLVTDESICGKASTAFNARQQIDGRPEVTSVYVVQAGEGRNRRYVVKGAGLRPDDRSEFGGSFVFDARWRFKSGYGA